MLFATSIALLSFSWFSICLIQWQYSAKNESFAKSWYSFLYQAHMIPLILLLLALAAFFILNNHWNLLLKLSLIIPLLTFSSCTLITSYKVSKTIYKRKSIKRKIRSEYQLKSAKANPHQSISPLFAKLLLQHRYTYLYENKDVDTLLDGCGHPLGEILIQYNQKEHFLSARVVVDRIYTSEEPSFVKRRYERLKNFIASHPKITGKTQLDYFDKNASCSKRKMDVICLRIDFKVLPKNLSEFENSLDHLEELKDIWHKKDYIKKAYSRKEK